MQFTIANVNAQIDALPDNVMSADDKAATKSFFATHRALINAEIISQLTVNGIPVGTYTNPNPMLNLSGQLNQAGTHAITINDHPADSMSVFAGTWSASYALKLGQNNIIVRALGRFGEEIG